MDHRPSIELLESVHQFPGTYCFKVIGTSGGEFQERVVRAARAELAADSDLDYSVRKTSGGKYIALTLEASVQTAEQVRSIYARLVSIEGLQYLF